MSTTHAFDLDLAAAEPTDRTDRRAHVEETIAARYPHLSGDALEGRVRRVMAIIAHSNDGPRWTQATP